MVPIVNYIHSEKSKIKLFPLGSQYWTGYKRREKKV